MQAVYQYFFINIFDNSRRVYAFLPFAEFYVV